MSYLAKSNAEKQYALQNQITAKKRKISPASIVALTILILVTIASVDNAIVFKKLLVCDFIIVCVIFLRELERQLK